MNEITNQNSKMVFFQANGLLLLEKEGYWQEMKPLLDTELKRVGEGSFFIEN